MRKLPTLSTRFCPAFFSRCKFHNQPDLPDPLSFLNLCKWNDVWQEWYLLSFAKIETLSNYPLQLFFPNSPGTTLVLQTCHLILFKMRPNHSSLCRQICNTKTLSTPSASHNIFHSLILFHCSKSRFLKQNSQHNLPKPRVK